MLIYWVCPVIQQAAHRPNNSIKGMKQNQGNDIVGTSSIQTRSMLVSGLWGRDDYLGVDDKNQLISGWSTC